MSRGQAELGVTARLAAFAAALVVAGLLGAGLGAVVGPVDVGGDHTEAPATGGGDRRPGPTPALHRGPHG